MKIILVARVSTVWMDPNTSREYLIVGDEFIRFLMMMDPYLNNPNQVRAFNIPLHDNPFETIVFGIGAYKAFIPLTSKGGVIRFESRVPKAWEEQNSPVIMITGYLWDTMNVELGSRTGYLVELRTNKSLTSGMK